MTTTTKKNKPFLEEKGELGALDKGFKSHIFHFQSFSHQQNMKNVFLF